MAANPIRRQYIMLKPMMAGANGFARLEAQSGGLLVQLTCKDLRFLAERLRVFLYAGEGIARELGQAAVNAQGQATLTAEVDWQEISLSPVRLEALLVLSDDPDPKPLLIGLCAQQSAGSLLDAKNAMLALCKKLSAQPPARQELSERPAIIARAISALPEAPIAAPPKAAADAAAASEALSRKALALPKSLPKDTTPQEVFLSAIDPRDYLPKPSRSQLFPSPMSLEPCPAPAQEPTPSPKPAFSRVADTRPVERLRPLIWPARLRELPAYFDRYPPVALFNLPGWRFIRVPMSGGGHFAIGYYARNGRVARIAYAVPGNPAQPPPRQFARYRFHVGLDGQGYWTLGQEVR